MRDATDAVFTPLVLSCKNCLCFSYSVLSTQPNGTPLMLFFTHSNISKGVFIGHSSTARFTVPPTPFTALFPCEVAKLPLRFDIFMVFFMVSQISEVKLVFILAHCPVGKVKSFFDISQVSHIVHETFHERMHRYIVMMLHVGNNDV
jgi:hypothetical protein